MRICIVTNGYPSKENPQIGCFERDQALALLHAGHQVSIIYVDRGMHRYKQMFRKTHKSEDGLEIFGLSFPLPFLNNISYKCYYKVRTILLDKVYRYMLEVVPRPDVIHAHFLYNIAFAVSLKKKYHIPLVGTEHWSILNNKILPEYIHYWANIAYSNVDCLIAVADSLRVLIDNHFGKKSVVLHNMIGEEFLNIPTQKMQDDTIHIVSTGSLIYRKGFDVLIKALSLISEQLPKYELTIIGEGEERVKLQDLINKNNLIDKVNLIGRRTKREIIEIYSKSSFFVLSSRAENFSVAVLEALSAGLPVIATLCGGIKECIDDKNGLLVPVDDAQELANKIVKMVEKLDSYDRSYIKNNCLQRFSPSVIAQNVTDIYRQVLIKNA